MFDQASSLFNAIFARELPKFTKFEVTISHFYLKYALLLKGVGCIMVHVVTPIAATVSEAETKRGETERALC